jgi:hypothetical protein
MLRPGFQTPVRLDDRIDHDWIEVAGSNTPDQGAPAQFLRGRIRAWW